MDIIGQINYYIDSFYFPFSGMPAQDIYFPGRPTMVSCELLYKELVVYVNKMDQSIKSQLRLKFKSLPTWADNDNISSVCDFNNITKACVDTVDRACSDEAEIILERKYGNNIVPASTTQYVGNSILILIFFVMILSCTFYYWHRQNQNQMRDRRCVLLNDKHPYYASNQAYSKNFSYRQERGVVMPGNSLPHHLL